MFMTCMHDWRLDNSVLDQSLDVLVISLVHLTDNRGFTLYNVQKNHCAPTLQSAVSASPPKTTS